MRIVIDLDGTICELKKQGQTYEDVRVNPGAAEKIQKLKKDGHYIILQTARHMKTCDGDVNLVKEKIGNITIKWLTKNKIPYDELHFGKPYGHVYIDDLAYKFTNWNDIQAEAFDDTTVNIVIPMAGHGSRFVKEGFQTPKPLIKISGKPMIQWAMESFDFCKSIPKYRMIFIILENHKKMYNLDLKLKEMFKGDEVHIITLQQVTKGQAETCLAAKNFIDSNNKLFIYNCDTYTRAPIWEMIAEEDPDGIIPCFASQDPKFSYAKIDEWGYVENVQEKKVISKYASTGMYYFKRGLDFVDAAKKMIYKQKTSGGEYYVAPIYNLLIDSGKRIRILDASNYHVFGTPEELRTFEEYLQDKLI